ncbi:AMP-binding protein [Roseibium album]|uniref:Long-chain-fatty-acid--CoA ligase n=1 Tax=Roseibium album TaxID=311410 RepID=A0A0M6ZLP4_9HYPH|nr:AMP-binding protein [Roseibium album]CTQ63287.1 Long-chain-fatty-acid--CoA ligase [Roseibium album]CTQ69602.1 Long-chain-fatty-acid--CoA ligase [Roseibium album]CTQ80874.1 Long-chain-fatty-acid--CoA ligase [Roseibium album]
MNVPGLSTVYEAFAATGTRYPDRPVLNVLSGTAKVYGIALGEMSYRTALQQIDALAEDLARAGYGAGMRVALLLENRPSFFLYWLAVNRIGGSVVPINPDLRAAELEYLIGHSEPALIVAIESRHAELGSAAKAAGVRAAVVGPSQEFPEPRRDAVVMRPNAGEAREAAILYTSGTTGKPKGCVLPNTYFLLAGRWYAGVGGLANLTEEGERMITPLPVFHMNAMAYSFMAMVTVGGCLTVLDRFHPRQWWSDVAASSATCLHYLGVMPSMLMGFEPSPGDRAHSVRFGFGAGVDPKLQVAFEQRFGFPLVEAWAMTETGAGAVIAASTTERLVAQASIGMPAKDVDCLIVDDSGTPSDVGELLVRRAGGDPRYGFFSEYYKDAAATAEAWQGGWFHTGDIVRRGRDGNMFFVDRKKNVIRRSGENIAAVEVESILMRHPDIEAAGIAPVPDPVRGDEVFACLKVRGASPQKAEAITRWCLEQMAYYKAPGFIAFVDKLPLTATQKIQRAALKDLAVQLLEDPDTVATGYLKKRQAS